MMQHSAGMRFGQLPKKDYALDAFMIEAIGGTIRSFVHRLVQVQGTAVLHRVPG